MNRFYKVTTVTVLTIFTPLLCAGQSNSKDDSVQITGQATFTLQGVTAFRSPYQGQNSLVSIPQARLSHTYTLFIGKLICPRVEGFIDPEMARGGGIGDALGLAGFTNGDVIRNPTLGQDPYLGRYFLRWTVPTARGEESVEKGDNQFAGKRPLHRVVVTAGKFGTNDIFDSNGYANSTRTQFLNWALINNPAYDYAADTRGYTQGVAIEWINPAYAVRFGSFLMPTVANGTDLDYHLDNSRGDQLELTIHAVLMRHHDQATVRLLGYRNLARMGSYAESLAAVRGSVPDIMATRQPGRVKYGFGLNFEQPLGQEGETGLFGRLGWSDGKTESFAYTEADDHVSIGLQVSGQKWKRKGDLVGVAMSSTGLSASHRDYLSAGGAGFILGDGKLNYGRETLLETYYLHALSKTSSLTFGSQLISNPGYNKDRGPVPTFTLRFHTQF